MNASIWLPALSILINLLVGFVLYKQIKSQKEIIEQYKTYIETLDLSKFKEYINMVEEMGNHKVDIEKLKFTKEKERTIEELKEHYNKYANEMGFYVTWSINTMKVTRSEKLQILEGAFPYCYSMLEAKII